MGPPIPSELMAEIEYERRIRIRISQKNGTTKWVNLW